MLRGRYGDSYPFRSAWFRATAQSEIACEMIQENRTKTQRRISFSEKSHYLVRELFRRQLSGIDDIICL